MVCGIGKVLEGRKDRKKGLKERVGCKVVIVELCQLLFVVLQPILGDKIECVHCKVIHNRLTKRHKK